MTGTFQSRELRMSKTMEKGESVAGGQRTTPPDAFIGIVVASTAREGQTHGRPGLLALWRTLSLLQGHDLPFLFLANPTTCLQFSRENASTTPCPVAREPSAVVAQRICQGNWGAVTTGRWLLVHLGHERGYLHPGLLPWLTLLDAHAESVTTVLFHDLHAIMSSQNRVVVAAPYFHEYDSNMMLQRTWSSLMSQLDHREQK